MSNSIYNKLIEQHLNILENLKYESGLFVASKKDATTGYNKAWLRDNFYECLAFEVIGDIETIRKTYRAILNIFKKHESKIDYAISRKPEHTHQYIHPRYNPVTFDEYWEEWGNKQNDSIGCILFKIGELEKNNPGIMILDSADKRVLQKLVWYWHDPDSGMWEGNQEVHASSVGACVAGLDMIKYIDSISVPEELLLKGRETLHSILPRESASKFVDLALLSLIWPYNIVNQEEAKIIIANVEYHLLKERGVIRYKGDHYYNKNPDGWSEEAEWTFGLSWLAIIYNKLGQTEKAKYFLEEAKKTVTKEGTIPELYLSNSTKYNDNNPLGWSESLFIVALYQINDKI